MGVVLSVARSSKLPGFQKLMSLRLFVLETLKTNINLQNLSLFEFVSFVLYISQQKMYPFISTWVIYP